MSGAKIMSEVMKTCEWKEESNDYEVVWITSCGEAFVVNEGTPEENGFKFCAYCGRKLIQRAAKIEKP